MDNNNELTNALRRQMMGDMMHTSTRVATYQPSEYQNSGTQAGITQYADYPSSHFAIPAHGDVLKKEAARSAPHVQVVAPAQNLTLGNLVPALLIAGVLVFIYYKSGKKASIFFSL